MRLKYVLGFVLLWFRGEAFTVSFKAAVNEEHVFWMSDMFSMFLDLRMYKQTVHGQEDHIDVLSSRHGESGCDRLCCRVFLCITVCHKTPSGELNWWTNWHFCWLKALPHFVYCKRYWALTHIRRRSLTHRFFYSSSCMCVCIRQERMKQFKFDT